MVRIARFSSSRALKCGASTLVIGVALLQPSMAFAQPQTDEGKPLDVSGGLPDGSKFEGIDGLQKALLNRPELFASTFTEKLLTYALGRGVEYYDAPAVRRVVHDAATKDYKFSSFILGITASTPFQMRRSL